MLLTFAPKVVDIPIDRERVTELLEVCRGELDGVRQDIAWNNGDRSADDLLARLRRIAERLEMAIGTVTRLDRLVTQPSLPAAGAPMLAREAEHRVRNGLTTVIALLQRQAAMAPDEAVGGALRMAGARVAVVAQLHAFIDEITLVRGEDREIMLDGYLCALCRAIGNAMEVGAAHTIEVSIEPIPVTPNTAQSLGLVVTELVVNALRHAFQPGQPGRVRVTAVRHAGEYRLTVADDGVGLPGTLEWLIRRGRGLRLVKTLADQLRARLEGETAAGCRFTLAMAEPLVT